MTIKNYAKFSSAKSLLSLIWIPRIPIKAAAARTNPDAKIHLIGSEKLGKDSSIERIPLIPNINGANKAVSLKTTHYEIHHVRIHKTVPNAIWGAKVYVDWDAATSTIVWGVGINLYLIL